MTLGLTTVFSFNSLSNGVSMQKPPSTIARCRDAEPMTASRKIEYVLTGRLFEAFSFGVSTSRGIISPKGGDDFVRFCCSFSSSLCRRRALLERLFASTDKTGSEILGGCAVAIVSTSDEDDERSWSRFDVIVVSKRKHLSLLSLEQKAACVLLEGRALYEFHRWRARETFR